MPLPLRVLLGGGYAAGGGHFLHFVVGGLVLDAEAEEGGAFDMFDGEFFGQGVPEAGGTFGATVVVAKDYAAGLDDLEGLGGFGGEAGGLVAGVAKDDFG